MAATTSNKVDRASTTPFLLKLFYKNGSFHRPDEFNPQSELPSNQLQIYTWQTCSLSELSHHLTRAQPGLLPSPAVGTRLVFRLIFPDTRGGSSSGPGRYMAKDLGSVVIGSGGGGEGRLVEHDDDNDDDNEGPRASIARDVLVDEDLGGDPHKTLADARFVVGDYITCAVLPPLPDGSVAPSIAAGGGSSSSGASVRGGVRGSVDHGGSRGGGGGYIGRYDGRENGYGGGGGGGGSWRGRGGPRGPSNFGRDMGMGAGGGVPNGEWRRGERIPDGPGGGSRGRGYGGGNGNGFGGGGGGGGGRGRY